MPIDDLSTEESRVTPRKTLLISAAILFAAAFITVVIFSTEPEAEREAATKKTAMLVDVTTVEAGDFHPTITAMGTVVPAQAVMLQPRVNGHVTAIANKFFPGGRVREGDVVLRLDPSDYQNQLQQRQSELAQATTALEIEMGEQAIAERDFRRIEGGRNLTEMQRALVLREPQLNAAKARVEAARANVQQARLDLERTQIKAPFDAQVLSRLVNVGSQVTPGDNLAELVGARTYWVEATLPLARLRWISVGGGEANVRIRNRTAWPDGEFRRGRLHSVIGELEGQTRMARVLIEVDDPLAVEPDNEGKMPLMIGSFVECRIRAEPLRNVVRIERGLVRKNDTAWVMENNALVIRELEIALRDEQYAYIERGLNAGDKVVTTSLSAVDEGAELRVAEASADG